MAENTLASTLLGARVAQLESSFRHIGKTRMQGLGVSNPSLRVRALGFERLASSEQEEGEGIALGVLVTPWFMNLIVLPLEHRRMARNPNEAESARRKVRKLGETEFEFIAMFDDAGVGAYEACSLFSPMFEFVDANAAETTALEVLSLLRPKRTAQVPVAEFAPVNMAREAAPSRRAFFLRRGASNG